ncbi:uncharacterized protein LOC115216338 isoform X1 [Octopus sinensis]|uniref:Uncharacterized protein LOC115216338 isoform X1 n=2 Tax=Octopus sinensis TaxID=2607531 RepID=A0A6P7ST57_9MOLL|nr:uncharacterized protein LOC115216338 isoform X1 [Octopus sinensis]
MFILTRFILLIAYCTALALGKCDTKEPKDILKRLKEMTKVPPKFDLSDMELLLDNPFYRDLLECPLSEAKPLYKSYEEAMKNALQHYENECPNFSTKMKEIQICRTKLVPTKLFTNGIEEFCSEYDHCAQIYNNTCSGLKNLPLGYFSGVAATEVCKLECKTKGELLNQMSNCWGFLQALTSNTKLSTTDKSRNYDTFYQCISSKPRPDCLITQSQALKIFPLFSHENTLKNISGNKPAAEDCITKWRILENLEMWTDEICNQIMESKDCILKHLKDEKKIMNTIHCKCYPANNDFPKFDLMDPDHKIKVISSSSPAAFDGKMVSRLYSVTLLLVTRFSIQL